MFEQISRTYPDVTTVEVLLVHAGDSGIGLSRGGVGLNGITSKTDA
jgi:hypothetical protein